jgi:hypothetical protein
VGLERGPLSLVSIIQELLGRKSSGSGLEKRDYGRRDPSRWPRGTRYQPNLALTSPTSGGLSVKKKKLKSAGRYIGKQMIHSHDFRVVGRVKTNTNPLGHRRPSG